MTAPRFEGSCAVVTGAASGIGRATVHRLDAEGATVLGVDRDADELTKSFASLDDRHIKCEVDLATVGGCEQVLDQAERELGRIDILVNAAGILIRSPVQEHTLDDWRLTLDVNLRTPFLLTRGAARNMLARGSKGSVVNVCSVESFVPFKGHAAYTASKGALLMLTRATAFDLAASGIRVNAVAPGVTATGMNRDLRNDPASYQKLAAVVPMERIGEPEEIAAGIAFLASDEASYVTGSILVMDGGFLLH